MSTFSGNRFENICNGNTTCKFEINVNLPSNSYSDIEFSRESVQTQRRNRSIRLNRRFLHSESDTRPTDLENEEQERELESEAYTLSPVSRQIYDRGRQANAESNKYTSLSKMKKKQEIPFISKSINKVENKKSYEKLLTFTRNFLSNHGHPIHFNALKNIVYPVSLPPEERDSLNSEQGRYGTFLNYRGDGHPPTLARNGFYLNPEGGDTCTRCYRCGFTHSTWAADDNILQIHTQNSPRCPLLQDNTNVIENNFTENTLYRRANSTHSAVLETGRYVNIANENLVRTHGRQVHELPEENITRPGQLSTRGVEVGNQHHQLEYNRPVVTQELSYNCPIVTQGSSYNRPVVTQESSYGVASQSSTVTGDTTRRNASQQLQYTPAQTAVSRSGSDVNGNQWISLNQPRPKFPEMSSENQRIQSFNRQAHCLSTMKLVEAGFFFTGGFDLVRCFQCGIGLKDWNSSDEPLFEHIKHSGECPFLRNLLGPELFEAYKENLRSSTGSFQTTTVSGVVGTMKNPRYAAMQARLGTYDKWPASTPQRPQDLADAGLYYTGSNDLCRCFTCDGGLRNWGYDDDPWIEHTRWFPKCSYVREVKGDKFINLVQQALPLENEEDTVLNSRPGRGPGEGSIEQGMQRRGMNGTPVDEPQPSTSSAYSTSVSNDTRSESTTRAEENDRLKQASLCKKCNDARACIVFLPCCHLVSCRSCAQRLQQCPECYRPIATRRNCT